MPSHEHTDNTLPVVADSWASLRKCDVYRLLSTVADGDIAELHAAANHVAAKRPDLETEALDCASELTTEYSH